MTLTYQIVYWRDIPSQVKVRAGEERVSRILPERFQEAIDEAAMLARTTSDEGYLAEWRTTEWQEAAVRAGEGPQQLAGRLVEELVEAYPPERLETLKGNKGYA